MTVLFYNNRATIAKSGAFRALKIPGITDPGFRNFLFEILATFAEADKVLYG